MNNRICYLFILLYYFFTEPLGFYRGAFLVENAGLEPVTSCMSSKRSNLLS